MPKICPVCKNPIEDGNHALIIEQFSDELSIADYGGVEALTEQQQMLYHNLVHPDCYDCLDCPRVGKADAKCVECVEFFGESAKGGEYGH